jgi:phage terminase large subunit-like protein
MGEGGTQVISRADLEGLGPSELEHVLSTLEQIEMDRESGRVPWLCTLPDCDGSPHRGRKGRHARADQRPPSITDWDVWLALAGRGWGKTRTGAEWSIEQARTLERGALVGPTAADTRDILVEGESGILACAPATFRPAYEPSKRRLTYPNGAIQMCYSADEPDRLRGPQHHYGWFDELAAWRRVQYAWDMAQLGMRLGDHPRICITTTPRPIALIKELLKDPLCVTVRGSTYDNLHNLAPTFRRAVVAKYEGTTLGRQELNAEVLDDLPGALLSRALINASRVDTEPAWRLRVVAMDPAGTGLGDETGLIAGGRGMDGDDYLTHDWSAKLAPREAAVKAWQLMEHIKGDVLVYEDNFGKGWVKEVLTKVWAERNPALDKAGQHPPLAEIHASAGKQIRAQPVVMRYEQGRAHHVDHLPELEDQYTTWIPEEEPTKSPDRVDAAVHLVAYNMKRFDVAQAEVVSPHGRAKGASVHPLYAARQRRELQAVKQRREAAALVQQEARDAVAAKLAQKEQARKGAS